MDEILNEDVGVAVDDHRHDSIVHLAKAVSVRDLWEQALAKLPEGTHPYPSQQWLRLQFWPRHKRAHRAWQYTGRFK